MDTDHVSCEFFSSDSKERVVDWLRSGRWKLATVFHVPVWGSPSTLHSALQHVYAARVPSSPELVAICVSGADLPMDWYVDLAAALAQSGVRQIELWSWAWWIGERPPECPVVAIADHIACHALNPLTGTEKARQGSAFVSMRDAYNIQQAGPWSVELWHTPSALCPSAEEIALMRQSGCSAAGPNVAPWAIGGRAAGCQIAAVVNTHPLNA